MIKNIFKIALLGVIGFGLLIYVTAEKPNDVQAKETVVPSTISYATLPANFELVGSEKLFKKDEVIKKGEKTLIIVGNHDSLAIVKDLKKFVDIKLPYVMVANISNAPWFIKKWAIPGKLEELNQGTNVPMIYDYDGSTAKSLNQDDTTKTKYFAYLVQPDGGISLVYTGNVKEGALDGSMNDEEKKTSLMPLMELVK